MTNNLDKRLRQHQNGESPYTKKFSKVELVYRERQNSYFNAAERERQLKGWSVAKKRALIQNNKKLLQELSRSSGIAKDGV